MKKGNGSTPNQAVQQELLPLNGAESRELARLNAMNLDNLSDDLFLRREILRMRAQAHPTSFTSQQPLKQQSTKKSKRQQKDRRPINTSRLATWLAVFILIGVIGAVIYVFVMSPSGAEVRQTAGQVVEQVQQLTAQASEGGGYECPPNIPKLEFDGLGVLQPPYPKIEQNPVNYCFVVSEYEYFLSLTGQTETTGEDITGLEWLAKTIAYPNYPSMLDEVRAALQDINLANNTQEIGWIQIPGHGGRQQGTPVPPPSSPDWNTTSAPVSPPSANATPIPTPKPTSTPVPTVQFAEIPVPQEATTPENPAVAQLYPEGRSYVEGYEEEGTTNPKLLMYQAMCKAFYPNVSIAELQYSGIWDVANVVEFNHDEYGTSALGPIDGNSAQREFCDADGSCYQIYVREACILQVTGFVWGGSIDHGGGVVSQPDWAQARLVPLYGAGDGKSNGEECYWHGMWHFPCETTYPEAIPSPTPAPFPTSTPFAGYGSLSDYVSYEWLDPNDQFDDAQWGVNQSPKYWARACPDLEGTVARMLNGGTCTHSGVTHMVNLQDVWDLLDTSQTQSDYPFFVVRCGHPMEPDGVRVAELGSTGVCFGPVK